MGGKICLRLMFHGISVLSKEHASIDQCSDCAISQSSKCIVDEGTMLL